MADRSTQPEKDAKAAREAAQRHSHEVAVEYVAHRERVIQEQLARDCVQPNGSTVYAQSGVILQDEHLATLRRRLQEATMAVNAAAAEYVRICKLAMVRRYN
jgi:hypothetical protein